MMLKIYCYRNKVVKAYGNPFYDTKEPKDMGISVARGLMLNAKDSPTLKPCDLYYIGEFDDETGKYNLCEPTLVLNCSDYFTSEELKDA